MNKSKVVKVAFLVGLVAVAIWLGVSYREQLQLDSMRQLIDSAGIWAPVLFICIYAAAAVFFLPGSALTISGGLIFGPWYGVLYNMIGALIGATLSFLIARYLASDWVAAKVGGKMKQLIDGVEREGWKFVAIVRLVPILPFNIMNYSLGLTKINVLTYFIASAVFMIPGCFTYTYLGSLGEAAITGDTKNLVSKIAIAVGLLILVSCIPWIVKQVRSGGNSNDK